MTTPNCSPYRDEILRHFVNGSKLSREAGEHYTACVHCMTAVTTALSNNLADTPKDGQAEVRVRGTSRGKAATVPEAARRAFEHGRRVLQREFGICVPGRAPGPE